MILLSFYFNTITMELSLELCETHYQKSRANYSIKDGDSHLAYYREKYPNHYKTLFNSLNQAKD